MLELKNIKKTYTVGEIETKALDGISLSFREREFVAILGISGSGKTTFLNIIGGLDKYDSGEMTIKGKSTVNFGDREWDAYRNNSVGFVFQNYNLITHQSIVANVELGMTLSGVNAKQKRERAIEVLTKVGLKDHLHKKPNQLSGGQMQRVAIARALANDPEILLCDEPTGALDSTTSVQIMDLIKELSKERLVIMVTHNAEIADSYADRIIRFTDGLVISDTNPYTVEQKADSFSLKRTSMSFFTALKLSANNLKTKKVRTALTSFASSIGIIGIAVIISLSSGFQVQIDNFQSDAMSEFPIIISQQAMEMDEAAIQQMYDRQSGGDRPDSFADTDEVYLYDPEARTILHQNIFTDEYVEYINAVDPSICSAVSQLRIIGMNLLREIDGEVKPVSFETSFMGGSALGGMSNMGLRSYPVTLDPEAEGYLEKNYDVLYGELPASETDIVLIIDTRNQLSRKILTDLGFETENVDSIKLSDIVGTQLKVVTNDDYYVETPYGNYLPGTDYGAMYASEKSTTLNISAVVRLKETTDYSFLSEGIVFSDALAEKLIADSSASKIVEAQKAVNHNIFSMEPVEPAVKEQILMGLGAQTSPYMIMIYPTSFENKTALLDYLDEYNEGRESEDMVVYTDMAETISNMTGSIMDGITIVLIAFAAVSLVVSLIMICIITYTSVIERTKEIGILRALGARKKDITRVFDAETFILGIFSGLLGIGIAYLLTLPINALLLNLTGLANVAVLPVQYAALLVGISTILTMLGGHIPAKMASRKDAVEALRSE